MADLISQLVENNIKITLIFDNKVASDRALLGWPNILELPNINIIKLINGEPPLVDIINLASRNVVHICQGVRSNGYVAKAQKILAKRGLSFWILMEAPNPLNYFYFFKKLLYYFSIYKNKKNIDGYLAIGHEAKPFLIQLGVNPSIIYDFAYFLPRIALDESKFQESNLDIYRFIFVGNLISRKNLSLLLKVLSDNKFNFENFELWVVGDGVDRTQLKDLAHTKFGSRIRWFGSVPMCDIPQIIVLADCLVLPSKFDGWGAVISESMMVGTRVICSNMCGAKSVIDNLCGPNIFEVGNHAQLAELLLEQLRLGKVCKEERSLRAHMANLCLTGRAGANYLLQIFEHHNGPINKAQPSPPWKMLTKLSRINF